MEFQAYSCLFPNPYYHPARSLYRSYKDKSLHLDFTAFESLGTYKILIPV